MNPRLIAGFLLLNPKCLSYHNFDLSQISPSSITESMNRWKTGPTHYLRYGIGFGPSTLDNVSKLIIRMTTQFRDFGMRGNISLQQSSSSLSQQKVENISTLELSPIFVKKAVDNARPWLAVIAHNVCTKFGQGESVRSSDGHRRVIAPRSSKGCQVAKGKSLITVEYSARVRSDWRD